MLKRQKALRGWEKLVTFYVKKHSRVKMNEFTNPSFPSSSLYLLIFFFFVKVKAFSFYVI